MIFDVKGMRCEKCTGNVERAVLAVTGVTEAKADLSQNQLTVEGNFSSDAVIAAVEELGFDCSQK